MVQALSTSCSCSAAGGREASSVVGLWLYAGPALDQTGINSEQIQCTTDGGVHHVIDGAWTAVKRGHRRKNNDAQLRRFVKEFAVTSVQRRLARHDQKPTALFQCNVGGTH